MDDFASGFFGDSDLFRGRSSYKATTAGCLAVVDFSSMAMQTLTGLSSSKITTRIGNMMTKDQIYMYENENGFKMWSDGFLDRFTGVVSYLRPSVIIIALDCKGNNWRKDIYSDYKFGRKGKISSLSCVDWALFTKAKLEMVEYLKDIGMLCVEVEGAEADDIIYCIARSKDNVVVVSVDGDMNQLAKWGVKIYNPIKRAFVEDMDAKLFLEIKTLVGDSGDYIHSVRGTFSDKKAVWPNTMIAKASSGGILNYLLENEEENVEVDIPLPSGNKKMKMSDIYIRNKQLIDMEYIPQGIIDSIMTKWTDESGRLRYDYDKAVQYNQKYADMIARYIKMI